MTYATAAPNLSYARHFTCRYLTGSHLQCRAMGINRLYLGEHQPFNIRQISSLTSDLGGRAEQKLIANLNTGKTPGIDTEAASTGV